jgi:hypothetical protein
MRYHHITHTAALAAAVAALAAPGASAAHGQDLRSPDARDAAAGRAGSPPPDLRSRMRTSSLAGTTSPPQEIVVAPAPSGFDWGDAGIGAAGGLGFALAGVAGTLAITGRRRHATAR